MENIALAVWGDVSLAVLGSSTGISKRMIWRGRDMRLKFNADEEEENREQTPASIYFTSTQHNDSDGSGSDSENGSSDDDVEMSRKRRRSGDDYDGRWRTHQANKDSDEYRLQLLDIELLREGEYSLCYVIFIGQTCKIW